MNTATLLELDTIYNPELNKTHCYQNGDFVIIYQPCNIETPEGTITAQTILINGDEIETWKYYSRGWGFWNFLDHTPEPNFELADEAMTTESYLLNHRGEPDTRIISETLEAVKHNTLPHRNEYWQQLVVRLAYNAITEDDALIQAAKNAGLKPFDVQKIIDRAMIAILGNQNFRLEN